MADLVAHLAGKVLEVKIEVGQQVEEDQEILILEAMKLEIPVHADVAGRIKEIKVKAGDMVRYGDVLAVVG